MEMDRQENEVEPSTLSMPAKSMDGAAASLFTPTADPLHHLTEMIQLIDLSSVRGPLAQLKEHKPMAKVSIPGMSTIFGDAPPCRRVVWTLVMIVCLSVATIQVYLSILLSIS